MARRSKQDDHDPLDFTEDEIAASRSDQIPVEVREFMKQNHADAGGRCRYYRKVAALASAETAALLAVRERGAVRAELVLEAELRNRLQLAEKRANALEAQVAAKDERITQLTAAPALAVHARGR